MGYREFIPKTFNPRHQQIIDIADRVMTNYARQGYDLSLRQLYYQFVAHHALPNSEQNYKMLGCVISDARLAGALDWDRLVDRGRETVIPPSWDSPADIVDAAASSYRFDLWEDQPFHVEVMVEKQALEGVLEPVCRRLGIPFTANKGYSSSSAMHEAGNRLGDWLDREKKIRIIYLGDHDPSGIDMSRDVDSRLMLFSGFGEWDASEKEVVPTFDYDEDAFEVIRVALNMDQVRHYNPPPNPAKMTDSRATGYVRKFGRESWELDALDPETLARLVTDQVEVFMDSDLMDAAKEKLKVQREALEQMAADYRAANTGEGA